VLQRDVPGQFQHSPTLEQTTVVFCGPKQRGAPGQNHTKRMNDINPYAVPLE